MSCNDRVFLGGNVIIAQQGDVRPHGISFLVARAPSATLLSILTGFISGVAFFSWYPSILSVLSVLNILLFAVPFLFCYTLPNLSSFPFSVKRAMFALFLLGAFWGAWRITSIGPSANSVALHVGPERYIEAKIVSVSSLSSVQSVVLDSPVIDSVPAQDRILLRLPKYPALHVGTHISIMCDLKAPEPFDGFAYDRYLAAKDIYATCKTREAPFILASPDFSSIHVLIAALGDRLTYVTRRIFPEPHSTLLLGLLTGQAEFSDTWNDAFLKTGTTHIVAASGSNIALVVTVVTAVLLALGFWKRPAILFCFVGIFAFVILAGGGAAVTRAAVMGSIVLVGKYVGRSSSGFIALLAAAAIMLAIEPRLLRDDTGFQLSVLSTFGLMIGAKTMSEKLSFVPETLGLRESLACTLAATVATLPVVAFGFGRISLVSPVVNLLILPALPYAMASGAALMALGFLTEQGAAFLSLPATLLLSWILLVVRELAALPFAVVNFPV